MIRARCAEEGELFVSRHVLHLAFSSTFGREQFCDENNFGFDFDRIKQVGRFILLPPKERR